MPQQLLKNFDNDICNSLTQLLSMELLTLSATASFNYQCVSFVYITCLVLRIKQLIIYSNLSKMKNNLVPTCLQRNYRDSLGEFSNTSYGVFGADTVKNDVMKDLRGWYAI